LADVLTEMSDLDFKWASRIIMRKLRTGTGSSSIEKAWPGLVPSFEVALADKVDWEMRDEKLVLLTPINYPVRVEPKWDGFRCVAVKMAGVVTMFARSGRVFERAPKIQAELEKLMPDDTVFDGELIGQEWNDTAEILGSRKNHKDDSSLTYHVFDALTMDIWKTQSVSKTFRERMNDVRTVINVLSDGVIRVADGHTVYNEEELMKYYHECLSKGYEGIMVKDLEAPYCFKRSEALMKLKPVVDYDCVVVGVEAAKEQTKWDGKITILHVRLPAGGLAVTRVGSGTNDEDKEYINAEREKLIGRACTIEGQPPLTTDFRIRFPRFVRWRETWDCSPEVRTLINDVKNG